MLTYYLKLKISKIILYVVHKPTNYYLIAIIFDQCQYTMKYWIYFVNIFFGKYKITTTIHDKYLYNFWFFYDLCSSN